LEDWIIKLYAVLQGQRGWCSSVHRFLQYIFPDMPRSAIEDRSFNTVVDDTDHDYLIIRAYDRGWLHWDESETYGGRWLNGETANTPCARGMKFSEWYNSDEAARGVDRYLADKELGRTYNQRQNDRVEANELWGSPDDRGVPFRNCSCSACVRTRIAEPHLRYQDD
jgi:hypothetical protein